MGIMDLFGSKKAVNHYTAPVECSNCKNMGRLMIAKGNLKEEAVKSDVCNKCGCETLKLISEQDYIKKNPPKVDSGSLF